MEDNLIGKKLIVLEDEETNIFLLKALLERGSADAIFCTTVDEFLDIYKGDKDIVLLDIKVPGSRDGIDLLKEIKTYDPDQPVIMTTAYPEKEKECWEHGCDEFISKPNTSAELIPKIMKLLSNLKHKR